MVVGDERGGKVRRRWRVPIRMDSDYTAIEGQAIVKNQHCEKQTDSRSDGRACIGNFEWIPSSRTIVVGGYNLRRFDIRSAIHHKLTETKKTLVNH